MNNHKHWITSCAKCGAGLTNIGSGRPRKYCYATCNPKRPKSKRVRTGGRVVWVMQQKLAKGECADCGWEITPEVARAFDLDHRDPATKMFELSQIPRGKSIEDIIAELAKCDLVCRNCHSLRPTSHRGSIKRNCKEQPLKGLFGS